MPLAISCSKAIRVLISPPGSSPASVTPRCMGTSGRWAAKRSFASITLAGSESLIETTKLWKPKSSSIAQWSTAQATIAPIESPGNFASYSGATEPQFTPTRSAQPALPATSAIHATLSRIFLLALVVVQVARVVAELRDVRGDQRREPVVLLQVHDQRHAAALLDLGQRLGVGLAVDRDTHERRARLRQALGLRGGGGDVLGVGRAHALHGDGRAAADLNGAGVHGAGGVPGLCLAHGARP